MKTSIASGMYTLSSALVVCTLVSTASRTTDTNTDDQKKTTRAPFDSSEMSENFDFWIHLPSTISTVNGRYVSKPTLSTPPVTDLNESLNPDEFVTDNAIDISTKPGNDYIPSDKENSYTTEPIPTTNGTQLLAEPPTRKHWSSTNPIANGKHGSKTTLDHVSWIPDPVPPNPDSLYSGESVTHWDSIEQKFPEELFVDWIPLTSTISTANGKYGSKPTLSTPPVTDLNDSLNPDEFVTDNTIDISAKPGNDYIPSDKENSYTTEPIPTTNGTQLLAEPPTRTTNSNTDDPKKTTRATYDSSETTTMAEEIFDDWINPTISPLNGKYGSKPTQSTPPVTDLNDSLNPDEFVTDNAIDISAKPGNDYIPSDKENSYTTEPIPTTNGTQLLAEPPTRFSSTSRTANTTAVVPNIPKYIPGGEGGGKIRKIVADPILPIVDIVVRLIRPRVEYFHNISDDNYEEIRSNNTTNTNVYEDIIVNHAVSSPEAISNNFEKDDIHVQNDWSQYKPAMMKTQISAVLRQPPQTSLPILSTSKIPPYAYVSKEIQPTAASILLKAVEGNKRVSRRRPVMTTTLVKEKFLETKKLSLEASRDDGEEHKLLMEILRLSVQQEVEKLKQEKIKTELLKLKIQRESGTEWVFDNNNEAHKTD